MPLIKSKFLTPTKSSQYRKNSVIDESFVENKLHHKEHAFCGFLEAWFPACINYSNFNYQTSRLHKQLRLPHTYAHIHTFQRTLHWLNSSNIKTSLTCLELQCEDQLFAPKWNMNPYNVTDVCYVYLPTCKSTLIHTYLWEATISQ